MDIKSIKKIADLEEEKKSIKDHYEAFKNMHDKKKLNKKKSDT